MPVVRTDCGTIAAVVVAVEVVVGAVSENPVALDVGAVDTVEVVVFG